MQHQAGFVHLPVTFRSCVARLPQRLETLAYRAV